MTDTLKLPVLARDLNAAEIEVRVIDDSRVQLTFPASSEAPVRRWWGTEVLQHKDGSIRMDRILKGAAPLLFNHNWDDPVGVVKSGKISGDRLVVDASLFRTGRGNEIKEMIDGGLRNVSIGYEIHQLREDAEDTFTAIDWEPLEVSVVTIPADPSIGIGRVGFVRHPQNDVKHALLSTSISITRRIIQCVIWWPGIGEYLAVLPPVPKI